MRFHKVNNGFDFKSPLTKRTLLFYPNFYLLNKKTVNQSIYCLSSSNEVVSSVGNSSIFIVLRFPLLHLH